MRTIEEIKREVKDLIARCPNITEGEIGKQLNFSYRFGRKLFDQMIKDGELCLKS